MKKILAGIAVMLLVQEAAAVTPGYYLVTTYENDDETNLDFYFWNVKRPNEPAVSAPEIGIAYGVTPSWYSELYASDFHYDGATSFSSLAWQNDYLLTHGQFPVDVAIHSQITHFHDYDSGDGLEWGPVVQAELARMQLNGNLFFEREYRAEQSNSMQIKYQWQAKYRLQPEFAFGLQGFGEMGNWRDWSPLAQQSHRAGPTVFFHPGGKSEGGFTLDAAYLFGKIFGQEAKTFTLHARYEF